MAKRLQVLPDADRVEEALVAEAAAQGGFADGSGFLTFGQLVERLEGPRRLGRRPVTPLAARVVLWSCAQALGEVPFGPFIHEPAFARSALELVLELKGGGLTPQAFAAAVEALPSARRARARYLARLYAAYEAKMADLRLADREDAVRGGLQRLDAEGLPPFLRDFGAIEIRELHDFPPLRVELLLGLARAAEKARVAFRVEIPAAGKAEIDLAVDPVFARFERSAAETAHVDVAKSDFVAEGRPLAGLGRFLFSPGTKRGAAAQAAPGLELLSTGTAREEARQLAARAARVIAEGAPPEQVAVAFRDLGEEAEWISEALSELGIPARVRLGAPLASTAAGRVALELPLLAEDGFPADRVAWLVGSRYLPAVSRGAPDAPAALLALASVRDDRLGAREGQGAYEVRLTALAERLARRQDPRAEPVLALRESCRALLAACAEIPQEARAVELLARWRRCVEKLGLAQAARQGEPREAEGSSFGRAVLRAAARDQAAVEALGELASGLEEAFRVSGAGFQKMARRTFHRWLTDAAADFNLAPRGPRGGAVRILDVRDLAGRSFQHLCVGGLVDGRFPGRPTPHPLFSDEDRRAVNQLEERDVFRLTSADGAGRAPWRLAEDRLLFFLALTASRGTVTLSFARASATGQEQVASPFVDELLRLLDAKVDERPARALPLLDEVLTEPQLRERVALEVLARRSVRTSEPDPAASAMRRRFEKEDWFKGAEVQTRIEEERLQFFANPEAEAGAYSGRVGTPELLPVIQALFRFDQEDPLSASELRRFGNCAFQGFLAYALKLGERDLPGEEPDVRVQGDFWHKALEELFPKLKAKGLLGKAAEEVPEAVLDEALDTAVRELESRAHVGHPALWRLDRDRARAMVRRLLNAEARGLPFEGHEPAQVELRFGHPAALPAWRFVSVPGVPGEPELFVQGKIDRVDLGPGSLGVVDYKKSLKDPKRLWEELLTVEFQLPLYLHAARASGHPGALHAAWLNLKDGELRRLDELLEKNGGPPLEDLLSTDPAVRKRMDAEGHKNLANALHALVAGLRAGRFPMHAQDCEGCSYRAVCRISERRLEEGGSHDGG